jgi:hypothetical protein
MMAVEAISQTVELGIQEDQSLYCYTLSDVSFESVMVLEETHGIEVLFTLYALPSSPPAEKSTSSCYGFRVSSTPEGCNLWKQNCNGRISIAMVEEEYQPDPSLEQGPDHQLSSLCAISADDIYKRLAKFGLVYGPRFRTLGGDVNWDSYEDRTRHSGSCSLQHPEGEPFYPIHPCSLDSGLQLNLAIMSVADGEVWYGRIPVSINKLSIRQKLHTQKCESCAIEGWGRNDGLQRGVGGFKMYCDEVEVECRGLQMVRTATAFSDT